MQTLPNYEMKRMIGSGAFGSLFKINSIYKDMYLKHMILQKEEK